MNELQQKLRLGLRSEQLHQVQGPRAIFGRIVDVLGDGGHKVVPLLAQLFLELRDLLPAPRAVQLRLAHGPHDAFQLGLRRNSTIPDDAINATLGVASAGGEVQPAVGSDLQVGHIQWPAFQEDLAGGFVGSAGRLHADGQNPPLRPIADEQGVVVARRKHVVIVDLDARRRAAADVDYGRQAVDVIVRPFRPAAAPAELRARRDVIDARGPVPGQPIVPFHVGIEREQLALAIESDVVGVAEAAGEDLHEAAVDVGADHGPAGRLDADGVSAGVLVLRLHQVAFVIVVVRAVGIGRVLDEGVISQHQVDQPVGTQSRRVRPMLAHAPLEGKQHFYGVRLAVLVVVGQAIEGRSVGSVAHREHLAVERQDALAVFQLVAVGRDGFGDAVAILVDDQQERAALARGEDFAELVEGHGHQRAGFGGSDHALHVEFLGDRETASRGAVGRGHLVAPRIGPPELAKGLRPRPARVVEKGPFPAREFLGVGPPGRVGRMRDVGVAPLLDGHAHDQSRAAGRSILGAYGHRIAALLHVPRDVESLQHFPIAAFAHATAIDEQLEVVVARDLNLRRFGIAQVEGLAEEAHARGRLLLGAAGCPNPLRLAGVGFHPQRALRRCRRCAQTTDADRGHKLRKLPHQAAS